MGYKLLGFGLGLTGEIQNYLYKAGAIREKMADIFKTVFAKKTNFTIIICKPENTAVQSKVSHESYLHMETTYKSG